VSRNVKKRERGLPGHSLGAMSRLSGLAAVGCVAAALVSGCGSSSSSGGSSGSSDGSGTTTLSVEFPAQISVAPVQWAIDHGLFAKQGIKLKLLPWTSPSTLPLLVNGQANIAYSGGGAVVGWASQGIGLKILASTQLEGSSQSTVTSGFVVNGNSSIHSPADLTGKTVAISGLKGSSQGYAEFDIHKAGGDPSKTKFVAVPFEGMPEALKTGKVDATVVAQPYMAQELANGGRFVGQLFPAGYTNYFFTTSKFATSHAAVLKKFIAVLKQADTYANAHYGTIKSGYVTDQKLPAAAAKSLPTTISYNATIDPKGLTVDLTTMKFADQLGKEQVNPSTILFQP
jgi:NitT/TauT family transport system substrate-binding protein